MIDLTIQKEKNPLWMIKQDISEMIYPVKVEFHNRISQDVKKLIFVKYNQKVLCYPTHLLFENREDAEIYAVVSFIKMYYSLDPFTLTDEVSEEMLMEAHKIMNDYEETKPDKFLYYWMLNVPSI